MDVKPNRLINLGYGKYWRSDQIVGLVPIEEERGPGRRTHVFVGSLDQPIVASRSEQSIRREMTETSTEEFQAEELRTAAAELFEELSELSPVLRRMLLNEGGVDIGRWRERLRSLLAIPEKPGSGQEDLFDR